MLAQRFPYGHFKLASLATIDWSTHSTLLKFKASDSRDLEQTLLKATKQVPARAATATFGSVWASTAKPVMASNTLLMLKQCLSSYCLVKDLSPMREEPDAQSPAAAVTSQDQTARETADHTASSSVGKNCVLCNTHCRLIET